MHLHFALNDGWLFTDVSTDAFLRGEGGGKPVRLPHTCREVPYDYFDESVYQMDCAYRRILQIPESWRGKSVRVTFGAAGHYARIYCNGRLLGEHRCGYTAFTVELGPELRYGQDNVLSVRLDTRETLDQPPFGFVIDYMTYGGLYREVCLDVTEADYISDVFARQTVEGKTCASHSTVTLSRQSSERLTLRQILEEPVSSRLLAEAEKDVLAAGTTLSLPPVQAELWSVEHPHLYRLTTQLLRGGEIIDEKITRIGFRRAEFRADGFYLNGEKLRLRGLNRHQSYPYIGYAAPESLQRMDAEILRHELGLNAVRTSHYPQSQHFIDRCDELGLLVFTEIPGWQHIGGEAWKEQAVQNVREMVEQYRNHPSVILWGVRINESPDDDELYTKTNALCRELDPTRATGGVRCIKNSRLLEDVYTYNDFLHDGTAPGCERKKNVTGEDDVPYLITEYNGHMFPTKMFDCEDHMTEHALRHARVLSDAALQEGIAGTFGWCMADYNTHKEFGSGDRICYHGVLDMFRNPKPAALVYAAEQERTPVLFLTSDMDIGEHPASTMGRVYLITNAERVRVYRDGRLLKEYRAADSEYKGLRHGPILLDDYIGDALITEEGMDPKQARLAAEILNYSAVHGFARLPARIKAKAARAVVRYRMSFAQAADLYQKYIGAWGDRAATYRLEAYTGGVCVKTLLIGPVRECRLTARADHTALLEGATYDMAAVRVAMCDENGRKLRHFSGAVELTAEGPIEIVGPRLAELRGGCGGTYIRTTGQAGGAALTLRHSQGGTVTIPFTVTRQGGERFD